MLLLAAITLLLDVDSGRVLASQNAAEAEVRLVTPGSTIKPFTLLALHQQGKLADHPKLSCPGRLTLSGRRLDCSHPHLATPLDAKMALAYSCNYWFATVGKRLERARYMTLLRQYGFWVTGAATTDLMALGEDGVTVTPLALAKAYRRLAQSAAADSTIDPDLAEGLLGAVEYGTAQLAAVPDLRVAGKTGTTASPNRMTTQAWFAGYAPADRPKVVVVVFADQGKGGATAAPEAAQILKQWRQRRP